MQTVILNKRILNWLNQVKATVELTNVTLLIGCSCAEGLVCVCLTGSK